MRAPQLLIDLIKRFEGLRLRGYLCPAGVPTCGYGSTGPGITLATVWTPAEAEARMQSDALVFLHGASKACPNAQGNQLAALADFAFNLGLTRLRASTLRKRVLAGDRAGARREIQKWVRGGGRVLPGLVARRAAEAALL
jgi:lysozyme